MSVQDAGPAAGGVPADLRSVLLHSKELLILRAFLHFEATSFGRYGFPIEVAWVFEDGAEESHLIRPAAGWNDWDPDPKTPNAIPRDRLAVDGTPVEAVARRLVERLGEQTVFASAPFWDCKWLALLLRSAGLSPWAIQLVDIDVGLLELAGAILAPSLPSSAIPRATRQIIADVSARFAATCRAYRALPDARMERERWLAVSQLAHAFGLEAAL
jgi:hypothetical protein